MQKFLLIIILIFLTSCGKEMFSFPSTKDVPTDIQGRVEKNIEEGRGISFGRGKKQGGVFDFASSNEMWRASIEVLDFVSFSNASYSGGIIITDWFTGNKKSSDNQDLRELKITVRFLSNEIRADGIQVIIHEKICKKMDTSSCEIKKIKSDIQNEIKLAILKKATILKQESNKKNKKKRPKKNNR